MAKVSTLRKALPYAAAAIGGAAAGGAAGYTGARAKGKGEARQAYRTGVERTISASKRMFVHARAQSRVRDRALRAFYVQNKQLSRQNQSLRSRLGEALSRKA